MFYSKDKNVIVKTQYITKNEKHNVYREEINKVVLRSIADKINSTKSIKI